MSFRALLLFSFFLICSCQSPSKAKNSQTESLLDQYVAATELAKTEQQKGCDAFTALSVKKDFILADVAYIRSLSLCPKETLGWDREVPMWLDKEKQLAAYVHQPTSVEKALFITKNPQYFPSPDRIKQYQQALSDKEISEENKTLISNALYSIAPRFMPDPQPPQYFTIVRDLRSVRELDKARDLLKKIIRHPKSSNEEKMLAYKEIFATNKLQRSQKLDAYIKAAKDWATFLKPNKNLSSPLLAGIYEAQLNYARVIWTEKGADPALQEIEKIKNTMQDKVSLADAYWLKARMLEEKKKSMMAVTEYENALKEKMAQWKDQEKILWSLAWTYFKFKNFTGADAHLQTLIDAKDTSPYARFKYTYWLAESRKAQGKSEDAQVMWTKLSDEDTFGYYGLMSRHQLNLPLRKIVRAPTPSRGISDKDDQIFKALQKVQEVDLANRFLAVTLPDSSSLKKAPATDIAAVLKLYAEVKNYKYVFQLFTQLSFETQRDVFDMIPDILFPQPYGPAIEKAAQITQVEPELIYSIMRQESSFDPNARSPMDAMGLVQILPEVARRIARENKIPMESFEDLFVEDKNILIGSFLLKKQSQQFNHKFPLYVASYNASGSAVRQWHKRFMEASGSSDLVFIEDIPYEETKTYVKLVMRNFVLYKKIKLGDSFEFFPAQLTNIQ